MSLNTVIKIGKLYRQSPASWQYHDQVNWAMNDVNNLSKKKDEYDKNIDTIFYRIPVIQDGDVNSTQIDPLPPFQIDPFKTISKRP